MNMHIRTKNAGGNGGSADVDALVQAFEQRDAKLIEKMATLQTQVAGTVEQLAEIEQKMARSVHGGHVDARGSEPTFGEQFTESEAVKSFLASGRSSGGVDLRMKATITSATADAAGSAGALTAPYRDQLVTLPQQPTRVRDLFPQIQISQPSVEIPVQTTRDLKAGMVAEGALKPQSDIQFELKTFTAKTIAHWMKASRQIVDDAPQLRGVIDTELLYGLRVTEDAQLLHGDGTGQNLFGAVPQATEFSAPIVIANATQIDTIGLALLQSSLAEFPADGVVMNPADWMKIRLTKDADGRYIYGDPSEAVVPRIFGVPVVPTKAMTIGRFLVGQFQAAGTIYDRWDARIELGYVNDDFIRNLITILAEERIAFAIKRPLALTYGSFEA